MTPETSPALRRSAIITAGHSDREIAEAVGRGDLLRLSRGMYLPRDEVPEGPDAARVAYLARCLAEADGEVLSHQSAAVMHGLGLLKPDLRRVHVVSGHRGGGRVRPRRHVHEAPYDDDVTDDGVSVTSLARTAVDLAKTSTFASALTVCDAALSSGADRDELADLVQRRPRDRGVRTALLAIAHADARSESPGESWSRAQMIEDGLPVPDLQVRFDLGGSVAYGDFGWDRRLIGEFDGRVKYQSLLRPGETPTDAVVREKAREDALRARGVMVVRWVWSDLEAGTMPDRLRPWLAKLDLL